MILPGAEKGLDPTECSLRGARIPETIRYFMVASASTDTGSSAVDHLTYQVKSSLNYCLDRIKAFSHTE